MRDWRERQEARHRGAAAELDERLNSIRRWLEKSPMLASAHALAARGDPEGQRVARRGAGVLAALATGSREGAVGLVSPETSAAVERGLRADLQRTQEELDGLRDALAAALQRGRETRRPEAVEQALRDALGVREATAEELARLPEVVRALGLEEWAGPREVGRALRKWQRRGAAIEGRILEGRMRWSVAGG